jgi:hypothetical protein
MLKIGIALAISFAAVAAGCKKDADKPAEATATAKPAEAKVEPTPSEPTAPALPPMEMVQLRQLDTRSANNWPIFEAVNAGNKTVTFFSVNVYAFDDSGKQVAQTSVSLAINNDLPPGGKLDKIETSSSEPPPPANAAAFVACYNVIELEGESTVTEPSQCMNLKPGAAK